MFSSTVFIKIAILEISSEITFLGPYGGFFIVKLSGIGWDSG